MALLLLFKIIDSLCLLREERTDSFPKFSIVRDDSMVCFPKISLLVFVGQCNTEISLVIKMPFRFLVSSF